MKLNYAGLLLVLSALLMPGLAAARGHRLTLGEAYKQPHAAQPKAHKPRKLKTPQGFKPVTRTKLFSYVEHEDHPGKD